MSHGDFNNDTPLDIAVIYQYPKSVDILLGHDNGTFNSIATLLTGTDSNPDYLSISDFNNDDRLNIAITNIGGNNIGIFLGYGNGTFIAQIILRTNEDAPLSAIVTSDFNNDGFKDIDVTILNNSELRNLESKLTAAIATKSVQWSEISNNVQSLHQGLAELEHLNQSRPTNPPQLPPRLSPDLQHDFLDNNHHNAHSIDATNNTIVLPPISSFPSFSGKPIERPRQFLLRVVEYAGTINNWSTDTLLQGISQFLKESALEWYCQLYITNNTPLNWSQFVNRFLARFYSPIRVAQQDNETINEFVARLQAI
ncbi:unnamed protein product [Rotaria magnacalcarata]|nr:unnamed protein product [Rotaria magnacalcarata]CAF4246883.1 unnamed protein product [Rotaria magnacalcarata]